MTDVGVRLPAPLTASGLAMPARLPARQVRALFPDRASMVQRLGGGPAGPGELRRMLIDVRVRGFALGGGLGHRGAVLGRVCGAGPHRPPAAAVALTYDPAAVDERRRRWLVERAYATADQLSRRLGGTGSPSISP